MAFFEAGSISSRHGSRAARLCSTPFWTLARMAGGSDPLVFVTGASSGIGLALARAVPWPGARVINVSRRAAPGLEHFARAGSSTSPPTSRIPPPGRAWRSSSPAS